MKKSTPGARDLERILANVAESARTLPNDMAEPARTILAIERLRWNHVGWKDAAIRSLLDINPAQFYIAWNQMIDDPAIRAIDPQTVDRHQRLRAKRQPTHSLRRQGITLDTSTAQT